MRYVVQPNVKRARIHPEIYGNFSEHLGRCIYGGVFVGTNSPIPNKNGMRKDVVEALRRIHLPVLRWPGGCFADEYHWMDGIGVPAGRKRIVNSNWGGVVEDNSFGTHEFFELCRQIGCEPYVNGNLGSGSVREMQQWVEYITCPDPSPMSTLRAQNGREQPWKLKYFGVGNENWGCGGSMRPEYYADEYRRYQTFVRNYGDNRVYKIACGPGCSLREPNYQWTDVLMREAGAHMDGLSLHYYTTLTDDWQHKGSATQFCREDYLALLKRAQFMDQLVSQHSHLMDRYDPEGRVGLIVDEWGTWYDVEPGTHPGFLYQQNTMRDAMVASLTLNIFNHHAQRVRMANLAQLANVLQALVLTDGARMLLTPTYHVFDLYQVHQGATLVESTLQSAYLDTRCGPLAQVSESASVDGSGRVQLTLANLSDRDAAPIELFIDQAQLSFVSGRVLTGAIDALNSFDEPQAVAPQPFEQVTAQPCSMGTSAQFVLPPCSVAQLSFG